MDTLYDASWITGYEGIMPRTEWSDGYSNKNCKLHKDIEKLTFAEKCEEMGTQYQSFLFQRILIHCHEEMRLVFTTFKKDQYSF